jgi:wyosine [tRNA(Phe)-imidazoG37] synthetase (radical SAM superfamily)
VTFSGSGEPALNSGIGEVLGFIKANRPGLPVAVLTNGTLFRDSSVRKEILPADLVLPSLDAASELVFRKINRPAEGLTAEGCIEGLALFRREYHGRIWLEVLIIPGYNDGEKELLRLRDAILRIEPDRVQLNTLDRPGTVVGLKAAETEQLEEIRRMWDIGSVEIIAAPASRRERRSYREDTESAVLGTIGRRPCTVEDLSAILGLHINEVNKYLDVLEGEGRIDSVRGGRGVFYRLRDREAEK